MATGLFVQLHAHGAMRQAEAFQAACITNGLWTGAVVLAGTGERVLFRQAWGWMDTEKRAPMPAEAVFDLSSVTKAVGTATALAVCIERGWVEPEAAFTNYLPAYAGVLKGPLSIRDLARHLSGFDNSKPYAVAGEVAQRIMRFSPVRPAGARYEYSCGNFILLGLVVEHAAKKDLASFCREHLFEPLGMRHTEWGPLRDPDPRKVVRQGIAGTLGVASDQPARHAGRPLGNAGLFSTADDLAAFCRMMLGGGAYNGKRVLAKETVRLLGTRPDDRSPVAWGWRVDAAFNPPSLSRATLSHTGWAGHSIWIDPASQTYVIVLTNRIGAHERANMMRTELAELVLRGLGVGSGPQL